MVERRESCPILSGQAWTFGPDLPARMILAPERDGESDLARWLLAPVDPDLPTRIARGDLVVAGDRVGHGADTDAPVRALLAAGVAALIASSFDPQFARHAFALGLPTIEVNEALAIHTGAHIRVDLEGSRVVNLSSGDRYPIRNATEEYVARFRGRDAGDDGSCSKPR